MPCILHARARGLRRCSRPRNKYRRCRAQHAEKRLQHAETTIMSSRVRKHTQGRARGVRSTSESLTRLVLGSRCQTLHCSGSVNGRSSAPRFSRSAYWRARGLLPASGPSATAHRSRSASSVQVRARSQSAPDQGAAKVRPTRRERAACRWMRSENNLSAWLMRLGTVQQPQQSEHTNPGLTSSKIGCCGSNFESWWWCTCPEWLKMSGFYVFNM